MCGDDFFLCYDNDLLCYNRLPLKKYSCYNLIAVAVHDKLVQNEFKNVPLEALPKRGRRAKAKHALEKNSIKNLDFFNF